MTDSFEVVVTATFKFRVKDNTSPRDLVKLGDLMLETMAHIPLGNVPFVADTGNVNLSIDTPLLTSDSDPGDEHHPN